MKPKDLRRRVERQRLDILHIVLMLLGGDAQIGPRFGILVVVLNGLSGDVDFHHRFDASVVLVVCHPAAVVDH